MRGRRVGIKPNTSPWLAWRAQGITATDVAAILGLSLWDSPFSLWWRKTSDRAVLADGGVLEETGRSQRYELGHRVEPVLHHFYAAEVLPDGWRLGSGGCWQGRGALDWMRATPDRVLYSDHKTRTPCAVVEFKTDAGHGFGDDFGDGLPEIPVYYRAQMLWQLAVVGVDVGWLSVLTGRMEVKHYQVRPQPDETAAIIDAAADFQRSLREGWAPPIDGSEATARTLRHLHNGQPHGEAEIDMVLAEKWRQIAAEIAVLEQEKQLLTNQILDAAGDAKTITDTGGVKVATRSVYRRKATDHAAVKTALESLRPDFPFDPRALTAAAPKPTVTLRPTRSTTPTATPIRRKK